MTHTAAVSFQGVSLRLRNRRILQDLNLELSCGELVALIGPGSSGKTQFLKLLATLHGASAGTIRLFGQEVDARREEALAHLRSRIGLQFQNFALFDSMTVAQNIAFPLQKCHLSRADIDARVERALADVGLQGSGAKEPSELSGGMRRRVSIARVMALAPDIALFDDPVSGLDPVASARIMRLIKTFSRTQGCLVVVASHDLQTLLPIASRVVALFDGHVAFDGEPDKALALAHAPLAPFLAAALAGSSDPQVAP